MVRSRGADGRIPRSRSRLGREDGASSSAAPSDHVEDIGASSSAHSVGFPGGPIDTTLLVRYEHHVARHIWEGEVRKYKL